MFDYTGGDAGFYYTGYNTGSAVYYDLPGARHDDIDVVFVSSVFQATRTDLIRRTFDQLNGAQWGTAVDIVGNTIMVGAPGKQRVAVYDLGSSDYTHWTTQVGSVTDTPLRPYYTSDGSGGIGSEVVARDGSFFFAGRPDAGGVQAYQWSGSWAPGTSFTGPGATDLDFGEAHTIGLNGNRVLIGASREASAGVAYLHNSAGTYLNQSFRPFLYNTNPAVLAMQDDTNANLRFGYGTAVISEGFYVVGTDNATIDLNKLYNFRQRGPAWTPLSANDLLVPAALPTSKLGASVAIGGNTAAIGARDYDDRGAVFVFTNAPDSDVWTLQATLQTDTQQKNEQFGASVALSGDTLVIGAPNRADARGAAYVFERLGNSWTQKAGWDGATVGGQFGAAVDVHFGTAIVGAPGGNAAYVFSKDAGNWTQQQQLTGAAGSSFGAAVAVHQDTIVVGAPTGNSNRGFASVYVQSGGSWSPQGSPLTAAGGVSGDRFGHAVDVSRDWLVVGAGRVRQPRCGVCVRAVGRGLDTDSEVGLERIRAV